MLNNMLIGGCLLLSVMHPQSFGKPPRRKLAQPLTATVEIRAFSETGVYLGAPTELVFEDLDERRNRASEFRNGIGVGIPFGYYRVEARLPGYFSDITYAGVYQAHVTIVVGLRFGQELPDIPPHLRGHISGLPVPASRSFVKLIGVYEHVSIESAIDENGDFQLGGLSPGLFLLMVIGEKGVLATRTLSIPYTGPPLVIEIKGGS